MFEAKYDPDYCKGCIFFYTELIGQYVINLELIFVVVVIMFILKAFTCKNKK